MTTTTPKLNHPPHPLRFTVQDSHRLRELGFLGEDDHIELIRGELIQMAAKETAMKPVSDDYFVNFPCSSRIGQLYSVKPRFL